jgi:hypothetical protein
VRTERNYSMRELASRWLLYLSASLIPLVFLASKFLTLKTVSYMGPITDWMIGTILASYLGSCLLSWRTAPYLRLAVGSILLIFTTLYNLSILGVFD